MKLFELKNYKRFDLLSLPYGLEFYKTYHYYPDPDHDNAGEQVFLIDTYDLDANRRNSSVILSPGEIHIRILPYDHNTNNKILRVRIMSGVDLMLSAFTRTTNTIHRNENGEIVQFPLKNHPNFVNFDMLTDEEIAQTYNRVRNQDDYGLVGHIWVDSDNNFHTEAQLEDPTPRKDDSEDDEVDNKLARAVKIFVGNRHDKRKDVIKMIAARLEMSENGATSYYTHAKHAIEDPSGKGEQYQHAVLVAKTL